MSAEPMAWTAVAMAGIANIATWLKIIFDKKKGNGPNGKMLINHEKRITAVEGAVDAYKEAIEVLRKENREDHLQIFSILRDLK
jgi:hypothetical protein